MRKPIPDGQRGGEPAGGNHGAGILGGVVRNVIKWPAAGVSCGVCGQKRPAHDLSLGVIGFGNIGKRVAEVARALGMNVLVAQLRGKKYTDSENRGRLPLEQVLKKADVVSIHTPLSDLTRNLIKAKELALMKNSAFLLNMARGGIVNEKDLARALRKKQIAGAASDVLTSEPPPHDHVLYNAPRFILTPHIAWASFEARTRLVEEIARNITAFEKGENRNRLV